MVNRTKISREIRRRTGGVSHGTKPKGKVTTNLSQKDWEKVPGTGTGRGNPPKYRMKEGALALQRSKFREKKTAPAVQEV